MTAPARLGRRLWIVAVGAVALGAAIVQRPSPAGSDEHFDVLIRGGRVIDGTGNPWVRADVGLRDGRIAAVGLLPDATADRTIDATGRMVAPGFIDIHSHADDGSARIGGATIRTDTLPRKAMPNIVAQGVTTVVVNHDGRSPWPITSPAGSIKGPRVRSADRVLVRAGKLPLCGLARLCWIVVRLG